MSIAAIFHTQGTNANLLFRRIAIPRSGGSAMPMQTARFSVREEKAEAKIAFVRGEGVADMGILDKTQTVPGDRLDRAGVRVPEEHIERILQLFPRVSADEESDIDQRSFYNEPYDEIFALYREFRPKLFAYVRSLYLTSDEAEDVIQEAFLRLTDKLLQKVDIQNVQGWVVHVAHDLAVDVIRRRDRNANRFRETTGFEFESLQDQTSGPDEVLFEKEQRQAIETALLRFTPRQRQCFHMRAEGLRYKDIGFALGISEQRAALVVKQVIVRLTAIFG